MELAGIGVPSVNLEQKYSQFFNPQETQSLQPSLQQNPEPKNVVGFNDSDILIKQIYDDDSDYNTRLLLNNKIRELFPSSGMEGAYIDMISRAIINKVKYNTEYPFEIENVINMINGSIK